MKAFSFAPAGSNSRFSWRAQKKQRPPCANNRRSIGLIGTSALTTQAQRPGPRDAWIVTGERGPGSVQRMVRRVVAAKKVVDHVVELACRVRDWLRRFQL